MKKAIFYKKSRILTLFVGKNTTENLNCENIQSAKNKIKNSGIDQELTTINQ